jgi:hypothetical protein
MFKVRGKRIKVPKTILGDVCVLRLEVEAVIPDSDPSEPCLEPDTVRFLDRLQELANAGNLAELEKHGTVYVRRPSAGDHSRLRQAV